MWTTVDDLSDPYGDTAEAAVAAASQVLWALSGRVYSGVHSVTEMYDARYLSDAAAIPTVLPAEWDFWSCSQCGYPHRMRLRGQPVRAISSVLVDGSALDPQKYALVDHAYLAFKTGVVCCSTCIEVTYRWGVNPPAGGRRAATTLAEQLVLAWSGSSDCRLPRRVQSVSRQGVSWTILDPQDFLNDGRTGIYEIDLFLKSVNPTRSVKRARVFSPDLPRASTLISSEPAPAVTVTENDLGVVSAGSAAWYVVPSGACAVGTIPVAFINGVERYGTAYFTSNSDDSWTLSLSPEDTWSLTDGDTFSIVARPDPGPGSDTTVSTGVVRFLRG